MDSGVTGIEKDENAMLRKGVGEVETNHDQIDHEVRQGAVAMADTYVDWCY